MGKKGFTEGYQTYDTSGGYGNASKWKQAFSQRMNAEDAAHVLQQESRAPHEILGIERNASPAAIKKAFRQLIVLWHPDRNQHRLQEAEEMSKKIIAAYTVMMGK